MPRFPILHVRLQDPKLTKEAITDRLRLHKRSLMTRKQGFWTDQPAHGAAYDRTRQFVAGWWMAPALRQKSGSRHARAAVARWTHTDNTERPHSALGYQAPAVFAARLAAMGDQLRAAETLRRSPFAPSTQPRQIQQGTQASAG